MAKPVLDLGDRKSIKETIQTLMLQKIEAGQVRNHTDVRAALSELDGLEFKPLTEKQLEKRRKADAEEAKGGKPRRRDTRITMRVSERVGEFAEQLRTVRERLREYPSGLGALLFGIDHIL